MADSAEILFQSKDRECRCTAGHCGQFRHEQGCPLFDVVRPAFPLPITPSHSLQGDLKEAVMVRDMPEPCETHTTNRNTL